MTKTFDANTGDPIPGAAGYFTARAVLTATFGAEAEDSDSIDPRLEDSVTGTVMNFRNSAGEMIDEDWEVELMQSTGKGADWHLHRGYHRAWVATVARSTATTPPLRITSIPTP